MNKNIKVIGIISSSKINGNTSTLVRKALEGAKSEGASVEEISLSKYKLGFCSGCLRCCIDGKCSIDDNFEEIRKKIYEADGIILGSPTYAGDYNAIMKNLFERLGPYTLYASLLGGKYGAGISTAYGNGSKKVAKKLTSVFKFTIFNRCYISGSLGAKTIYNGAEKNVSENRDALDKAYNLGRKIANDINSEKKYRLQNLFMRMVITLYLKNQFKKYITKNKDHKEKATYISLNERGLI
jgi:multimeric flavodoxin WrbA